METETLRLRWNEAPRLSQRDGDGSLQGCIFSTFENESAYCKANFYFHIVELICSYFGVQIYYFLKTLEWYLNLFYDNEGKQPPLAPCRGWDEFLLGSSSCRFEAPEWNSWDQCWHRVSSNLLHFQVQYSTVQYNTVPPPLPDQLPSLLPPGHHDSHRPLPSLHAAGRHLHRLRSV